MREYLEIGSSPANEDCAQVGSPDYAERSRMECKRFIELIRAKLGVEPEGAVLSVKSFPHDLGSYREVICYYDDQYPASVDYAFKVESEAPTQWEHPSSLGFDN